MTTWEQIEGQWTQASGQAKSQWAKLTDEDFKSIGGKQAQLVARIEARYSISAADAQKQVTEWVAKYTTTDKQAPAADANAAPATDAAPIEPKLSSSSDEHAASMNGKTVPTSDKHDVAIEAKDMPTVGKHESAAHPA